MSPHASTKAVGCDRGRDASSFRAAVGSPIRQAMKTKIGETRIPR
jgi:hypothetical protein